MSKGNHIMHTLRRCAICEGVYPIAEVQTRIKIDGKLRWCCVACDDDLIRNRPVINELLDRLPGEPDDLLEELELDEVL